MKTLIIFVHPDIEVSRINKTLIQKCENRNDITINYLYQKYPDFKINVSEEQNLLTKHSRIVFQFPMYWYSFPSLLKEWLDKVLTYGWAFGSQKALHGKELILAVSSASPSDTFMAGCSNNFTISELLRPLQQTANYIEMKFLPTFITSNAMNITDEELEIKAEHYLQYITAEKKH